MRQFETLPKNLESPEAWPTAAHMEIAAERRLPGATWDIIAQYLRGHMDAEQRLAHKWTFAMLAGKSFELGLSLGIFAFDEQASGGEQQRAGTGAGLGIGSSNLQKRVCSAWTGARK